MPIGIRNTHFERVATQKAVELIERLKKKQEKTISSPDGKV